MTGPISARTRDAQVTVRAARAEADFELLPATLDGRRPCRNHSRCRRQAIAHSPLCGRCFDAALTAAFGQHVEPRAHVARLSEQMPELHVPGRRGEAA